jgi:hypothetical protein
MSFKCLVISVLIMLCLSHPIFCQEVITSFEETSANTIRNKFSIGVDKLPWDRDKIFSLRLWRNNNKGNEFSIGSIQFKKGKEDEASIINVNFSNIRYVLLYRKKNNRIEGLFITRGIGLSTSFNY